MKMANKSDRFWATAETEEIGAEIVDKAKAYYRYVRDTGKKTLYENARESYYKANTNLGDVNLAGEADDQIDLNVNHFRNLVTVLLNLVTKQKVSFDPKATNTDSKSQSQCILAKGIIEYVFRDHRLDQYSRDTVERSILFGEGALLIEWSPDRGELFDIDTESGKPVYTGGLNYEVLSPLDLV